MNSNRNIRTVAATLAATPERGGRSGFTLLEVILALSLAVGLLFTGLLLYRQTAALREGIQAELEAISAARLIMDRLTGELQGCTVDHGLRLGLHGSANEIRFLTTALPPAEAWTVAEGDVGIGPQFDLRTVHYRLAHPAIGETDQDDPSPVIERTERRFLTATGGHAEASERAFPLSSNLRYMRLRYHDGWSWRDDWHAGHLPVGVEVTLAEESPVRSDLPETGETVDAVEGKESFPLGVFRRVICLPAAGAIGGVAPSQEGT